jgi:squalene-associated FAD-dependent desaturase
VDQTGLRSPLPKSRAAVAIIGGGCAGLSTALALVERGFAVTLFEAAPQLGGRARSVGIDTHGTAQLVDNGQHMLLGAYHETLALLRKVGVDEQQGFLRLPLQINMQSTQARSVFNLKSAHYLPAPLNMLIAVLGCKGISFKQRVAAVKFMLRLKKTAYLINHDQPLAQFLQAQQQTKQLIHMLWEPLCLAALNTPIAIASTRIFLNILRDTLHGSKSASDFLLPKLDLSQLMAQPLAQYIQARGGEIRLKQQIRKLTAVTGNNGQAGFSLDTVAGQYFFSQVVIATAPEAAGKLLQALPLLKPLQTQIQAYRYQPIYTIYLQYDAGTKLPSVMTGLANMPGLSDMTGLGNMTELSNMTSQWLFDRGQLCAQDGLMAVVVSACGPHQQLSQDELAHKVAHELSLAFPQLIKPLWHKVIAEKRATFSCEPDLVRPAQRTEQPGLFLAGDYCYADYPATIEGAIRSGIACAALLTD